MLNDAHNRGKVTRFPLPNYKAEAEPLAEAMAYRDDCVCGYCRQVRLRRRLRRRRFNDQSEGAVLARRLTIIALIGAVVFGVLFGTGTGFGPW